MDQHKVALEPDDDERRLDALLPIGEDAEALVQTGGERIVHDSRGVAYLIDGIHYRLLPNGAIYDIERGHITANVAGSPPITRENASEMASLRWQKARQAATEGLRDVSPSNKTEYDAWKAIIKAQAQLAMDTEQGRASTEAARFVGQAADILKDKASGGDESPALTVSLSADAARELIARLAGVRRGAQ